MQVHGGSPDRDVDGGIDAEGTMEQRKHMLLSKWDSRYHDYVTQLRGVGGVLYQPSS